MTFVNYFRTYFLHFKSVKWLIFKYINTKQEESKKKLSRVEDRQIESVHQKSLALFKVRIYLNPIHLITR